MKFVCGPEWDERVLNLNPKKNSKASLKISAF